MALFLLLYAVLSPSVGSLIASDTTDFAPSSEKSTPAEINAAEASALPLSSAVSTLVKTKRSTTKTFTIVEVNGYLHLAVDWSGESRRYKCPWSDRVYQVIDIKENFKATFSEDGCYSLKFTQLCPADPGFYQACGHNECSSYRSLDGKPLLCGTYICNVVNDELNAIRTDVYAGVFFERIFQCKAGVCDNTQLNMAGCEDRDNRCNYRCDEIDNELEFCIDESSCNGVNYGIACTHNWYELYLMPHILCLREYARFCGSNVGCFNWTVADNTTCLHSTTGERVNVLPQARCFLGFTLCSTGQDQTNCSDPERVAMSCLTQGYPTTISIWGYCKSYALCDDDYNNACLTPETGCTIHKGQMCDGNADCPNEADEECPDLTNVSCVRRFDKGQKNRSQQIPLSWVMDKEIDCVDGIDEEEESWTKCGSGYTTRYQPPRTQCQEVLLCPEEDSYIELEKLCDRVDSCVFETELCTFVRGLKKPPNISPSYSGEISLQHCFPKGGKDIERQLGPCEMFVHTAGFVKTVLDVQKPVSITASSIKRDCSSLYGENYVYAACNDLCINAQCPLKTIPGDTCDNMRDKRVRSLADTVEPQVTTLLKTAKNPGFYDNRIFPCDNKNCVLYKKVCDLADDCGDGSDEINCINHFLCNNTKVTERIALSQVCDGVEDCSDFSDECLDRCPAEKKNILGTDALRVASAVMGCLATSLNTVSLTKSFWELRSQRTYEMFLNKAAITLICLGDLCIGGYLLAISYVDFEYQSNGKYCRDKYEWLTSQQCSILGVISTVGSQLSLLSMTMLSVTRVANVGNLIQRSCRSLKSAFKLGVLLFSPILASTVVAVIPILPAFEDYFVNGIFYPRSPVFIRPLTKADHYIAFEKYYDRESWKRIFLTWAEIRESVSKLFSNDHQGNS